jgi:hypothetical protein
MFKVWEKKILDGVYFSSFKMSLNEAQFFGLMIFSSCKSS